MSVDYTKLLDDQWALPFCFVCFLNMFLGRDATDPHPLLCSRVVVCDVSIPPTLSTLAGTRFVFWQGLCWWCEDNVFGLCTCRNNQGICFLFLQLQKCPVVERKFGRMTSRGWTGPCLGMNCGTQWLLSGSIQVLLATGSPNQRIGWLFQQCILEVSTRGEAATLCENPPLGWKKKL